MYLMTTKMHDAPTEPIWQSRHDTAEIPVAGVKQVPRHANPPSGLPSFKTVILSLTAAVALAIPSGYTIGTLATSTVGSTPISSTTTHIPAIQAALQAPEEQPSDQPAAAPDATPDTTPTVDPTPEPTVTTEPATTTTTEPEPTTTVPTGPVISSDGNGHYYASPPPAIIPVRPRPGQVTAPYQPPPQPKETPTPTPTPTNTQAEITPADTETTSPTN